MAGLHRPFFLEGIMPAPTDGLPFPEMVTEVDVKKHDIVGGRKMPVRVFQTRNVQFFSAVTLLSFITMYAIECESNDTAEVVTPEDRNNIRHNWSEFKNEYLFAVANREIPAATSVQEELAVTLPAKEHIMAMRNMGLKNLCLALHSLAEVVTGLSSNKLRMFVSNSNNSKIEANIAFVDRVMDRWIGQDIANPGVEIKGLEILGRVMPDPDLDYVRTVEPSMDGSPGNRPDTPDL
jgi:hypothetical protein